MGVKAILEFVLALVYFVEISAVGYEHYTKSDTNKPSNWCYHKRSCEPPTWQYLCKGRDQSPINLPGNITKLLTNVVETDFPKSSHNLNNMMCRWRGVAVHVEYMDKKYGPQPTFGLPLLFKETYHFASMHVHVGDNRNYGSEHTINGKSFAGEVHLCYYSGQYNNMLEAIRAEEPNAIAVIAVLLDTTDDDKMWDTDILHKVTRSMVKISETSSVDLLEENSWHGEMYISEFFKGTSGYAYVYEGSLTTPPCAPARWFVLRNPVITNDTTLERLRRFTRPWSSMPGKYIPDNFRPLQTVGDRKLRLLKFKYN